MAECVEQLRSGRSGADRLLCIYSNQVNAKNINYSLELIFFSYVYNELNSTNQRIKEFKWEKQMRES